MGALFTIFKNWKQPSCPSKNELVNPYNEMVLSN